jgi:hypothetical protein
LSESALGRSEDLRVLQLESYLYRIISAYNT